MLNEGGFWRQLLQDAAGLEPFCSHTSEGYSADCAISPWSCGQNDLLLLQGYNLACIEQAHQLRAFYRKRNHCRNVHCWAWELILARKRPQLQCRPGLTTTSAVSPDDR